MKCIFSDVEHVRVTYYYTDLTFCSLQSFIDGLLSQDQQELSERVAHLEKRVREQDDEIVCLKGALADITRRLGSLETAKRKFYQI